MTKHLPSYKKTIQTLANITKLQPNTYYPAQIWYQHLYNTIYNITHNIQEAKAIATQILAHHLGYTSTHHLLNTPLKASTQTLNKLDRHLQQLSRHEPLQYILGYTSFLGHTFKITKGVFIPRSETEQMTHHIIQQQHPAQNILDLCTGSGCIAISLKKNHKKAQIDAIDISNTALKIARENAQNLNTQINWLQLNLLHHPLPPKQWHLIVSNPPYIPLAEKKQIKPNILHQEPHQALFVPDHNPLLFYKRIALLAKQHLTQTGSLYVEIHENLSKQTAQIFKNQNLKKVQIHKDLHGKNRWITCRK